MSSPMEFRSVWPTPGKTSLAGAVGHDNDYVLGELLGLAAEDRPHRGRSHRPAE
jgi:hypothetical protein